MKRLLIALLLCLCASSAHASLEAAVEGLIDRAADRPVHLEKFRSERYGHGLDLSCWNGCPYVGSQNIPVVAEAAAGNIEWIAELARTEMREGLASSEIGSPGVYYQWQIEGKMVALRDARRQGRGDIAAVIEHNLRATWAYESLTAIETPRTYAWANLAGDVVEGPGNAADYLGLTVASSGNRWNGSNRGEGFMTQDAHGPLLSLALDWMPRAGRAAGKMRNPKPGRGSVVGFLAGIDRFDQPTAAEVFGLTDAERELLSRVVRGDVEAARVAAGWVAEYGVLHTERNAWKFRLRRTSEGAESVYFGPFPNPNKVPHAATSITNAGEWRTLQPSRYGRRNGQTIWGYTVEIEGGVIHSRVDGGPDVSMPEIGGALLWQVTIDGGELRFEAGGAADASRRDFDVGERDRRSLAQLSR